MFISTLFAVNSAMRFVHYRRIILLTLPIHEHLFIFRGKSILLRHWLRRIKEGYLTYPTRPIRLAGPTNMNNYSFYARKGILIPYWLGPISEGSHTYPPRPISATADKVARAMRVYCVPSPQGTTELGKHPQPWHRVQHVRVYMNSSNESPVILYFNIVSIPRDTT